MVTLEQFKKKIQDIPDTIGYSSSKYFKAPLFDFPDDSWLNKPGYELHRIETAELATLGRSVIPMLSSDLSEKAIAILFILAYNLRRPARGAVEYVYPDYELGELGSLEDMDPFHISDYLSIRVREPFHIAATTDLDREAMYYSFIAASTLRLFTKPPENYLRAFTHICNMFPKFYGVPCPVRLPTPNMGALGSLSAQFSNDPRCKVTLYRILYLSGGEENEEILSEMKRFLYDAHLAYTGLHVVRIFLDLCEALNCNTRVLLAILRNTEYERQVNILIKMIEIIESPLEKYKRKMFRYGRLFDHAFMSPLRTRTCSALTYTLASALKKVARESHEGILDIVQLGDVSEQKRRLLDVVAEKIIEMVRRHPPQC